MLWMLTPSKIIATVSHYTSQTARHIQHWLSIDVVLTQYWLSIDSLLTQYWLSLSDIFVLKSVCLSVLKFISHARHKISVLFPVSFSLCAETGTIKPKSHKISQQHIIASCHFFRLLSTFEKDHLSLNLCFLSLLVKYKKSLFSGVPYHLFCDP
jgi:hypothetical protein